MKTRFTLLTLTLVCILITSLKAQINEGFEKPGSATYGQLDYYMADGWSFYGAAWNNTSQITDIGSIRVIATTSTINNNNANSNTTQVVTPWVNLTNGGKITFNYKLASALGNNQDRTFTIRLWDANNVSTTLSSFTITGSTPVGVVQSSPTINVPANSGNCRIIIDFTGRGDGNSFMFFDNLAVTPNTSNLVATTLPIKLLGFNGQLHNNKAKLEWNVDANETGTYFEIQKSKDGKNFSNVAMLFTTEKAGIENYQFQEVLKGDTYYRLYIVNKDHSIAYSKVILLKEQNKENKEQDIKLLQSPIHNSLRFTFFSSLVEQNVVTLYSTMGVAVFTTSLKAQQGNNYITIAIDNALHAGNYLLEVRSSNARRIVKVSK